MPKLSAAQVKKVEKAEPVTGSGFAPHSPGDYTFALKSVEAKQSAAGNPMWAIEFDKGQTLEGDELPGRQFYNLNFPTGPKPSATFKPELSENERLDRWTKYQTRLTGQIHAFFLAFGYTADSDTDEMLGERCIVTLGVETAQKGKRAGTPQNTVDGLKPIDGDVAGAAGAEEDDEDDDEF